MSEPILRLDGLSKYYTTGSSVVMGLSNVSLSFCAGEFVAITGESGSGKSTLAHVIGGILPYEGGELLLRGKPTSHYDGTDYERYRRDNISFISQSYGILPGCSVQENVISALRLSGMEKREAMERSQEILHQVELWELRSRRAAKLSSGQKQRLSIARALAKPAPILLADEPTGNLDPENSAKVISLLAQAAKTRLVILITHEFSEVEDHATRHIALQDGRVVMDAQLRPAMEAELPKPLPAKKQVLTPYVSRLQLSGRPVWCSLLGLFFTLTAFAVFAFLGTFIIALDDTDTRIYDNSAFRNGSRTRIVVLREDGKSMTEKDYRTIMDTEYVTALEPCGSVTDVNYGYRKGTDYDYNYTPEDIGSWDDHQMILTSHVFLANTSPFLQTVPVLPEGETFLTAGRLPENIWEVVLCGSADRIGETFPVYIQDVKNWSASSLVGLEVTVVGVTDRGSDLYFHGDLGRAFFHYIATGCGVFYLPATDLSDSHIRCSQYVHQEVSDRRYPPQLVMVTPEGLGKQEPGPEDLMFLDLLSEETGKAWHDSALFHNYYQVSQATFEKLTLSRTDRQISLTIADYAYTDRVIEALQEKGYAAISPFRSGSTQVDPELAEERKQTLTVCLAVLVAVLILQVTILRALFSAQTEGYRLLSNIGLTCRVCRRSILLQLLLFTVLGQLAGGGLLWLCQGLGVQRIVRLLHYLPTGYLALLSFVHLFGTALGAFSTVRGVTKQVFPLAGKRSDLLLNDEEVAP